MADQEKPTFAELIEKSKQTKEHAEYVEHERILEEMRERQRLKQQKTKQAAVDMCDKHQSRSPEEFVAKRLKPQNTLLEGTSLNENFEVISAQELLDMEIPLETPVISRLMPRGTYIFAGAPKVGKSWLVLWFAHQISMGAPIWDFETTKGGVLYLSLEDPVRRLKNRYMEIVQEAIGNLHFVTKAQLVGSGLEEQLMNFITNNPNLSLIIIDTLQKIREIGNDKNGYASDYEVMSKIKTIADDKNIAFLIVHHTRKAEDEDPFMTISGTNGLLGAADGAFVLAKDDRLSKNGKLYATGRDIEEIKLNLTFDRETCIWKILSHDDNDVVTSDSPVLVGVNELVTKNGEWKGTSTELLEQLKIMCGCGDVKANVLSRTLNSNADLLLTKYNIHYTQRRENNSKLIYFKHEPPPMYDNTDMCDILDTGGYPKNIVNIAHIEQKLSGENKD